MKAASAAAIDARYRQRAAVVRKIAKWPAIGVLVGAGALFVARLVGPSLAEQLGSRAGEGFARGVVQAQSEIAAIQRRLSISGWGRYR